MAGTTGAHCFIYCSVAHLSRDDKLRVISQSILRQVKHIDLGRCFGGIHGHHSCRPVILHIILDGIEFLGIFNGQNTVVVVLVVCDVLIDAEILQRGFAGAGTSSNSD